MYMPGCSLKLRLCDNAIGDQGARSLAIAIQSEAAKIHALYLDRCKVGNEGASSLSDNIRGYLSSNIIALEIA